MAISWPFQWGLDDVSNLRAFGFVWTLNTHKTHWFIILVQMNQLYEAEKNSFKNHDHLLVKPPIVKQTQIMLVVSQAISPSYPHSGWLLNPMNLVTHVAEKMISNLHLQKPNNGSYPLFNYSWVYPNNKCFIPITHIIHIHIYINITYHDSPMIYPITRCMIQVQWPPMSCNTMLRLCQILLRWSGKLKSPGGEGPAGTIPWHLRFCFGITIIKWISPSWLPSLKVGLTQSKYKRMTIRICLGFPNNNPLKGLV